MCEVNLVVSSRTGLINIFSAVAQLVKLQTRLGWRREMEPQGHVSFTHEDHTLIMNSEHHAGEEGHGSDAMSPKETDQDQVKASDGVFKRTWVYTPKSPIPLDMLMSQFAKSAKSQYAWTVFLPSEASSSQSLSQPSVWLSSSPSKA